MDCDISDLKIGLINLFIQHTSAGLTINENYDKDVREGLLNLNFF